MRALFACAPLLWTAACKDSLPPAPHNITIEPASGPAGLSTKVAIHGTGFQATVLTDFTAAGASVARDTVSVRLEEVDLLDAHVVGDTLITAVVPAGLALGEYDLIVVDRFGRTARARQAYEVRKTTCADANHETGADEADCASIGGCVRNAASLCTPVCGDGLVREPEQCDDRNTTSGDGCSSACKKELGFLCTTDEPSECSSLCGDGLKASNEGCDDGNIMAGDGCSALCSVEYGYSCTSTTAESPSVCGPLCGDGQLGPHEACDDANTRSNDGCSDTCQVEHGYRCPIPGSPCSTQCGDGIKAGDEECDDGNTLRGDGCSQLCRVEPGFTCPTEGVACFTTCGDGIKAGLEACDDGNINDADGCSSACTVEPGYACDEAGVCTPICGDGLIVGDEGCDDHNPFAGDGCSTACHVEPGWVCPVVGAPCSTSCGDGTITGSESCDDGNLTAGDGCSPSCTVETGWTCGAVPAGDAGVRELCAPICGDGIALGGEGCDDANTTPGDGCSAACAIEPGFACPSHGGGCAPICGDGVIAGTEACDDHNTSPGDGCSPTCTVEQGWHCTPPAVPGTGSSCATTCGDGALAGTEACDDGNTRSLDGCSSTCALEPGWVCRTAGQNCTPICGDGVVVGAEACDDHNASSGDGCSSSCTVERGYTCPANGGACTSICGDGIHTPSEECDDGNRVDYDGCDNDCRLTCGNGVVNAGEECDDGNHVDGDACEANCTNPRCGNRIVDVGEQCDDGNLVNADGCEGDCTNPRCGNGIVDPGEACDDGNGVTGDGCENDCTRSPSCDDGVQNHGETGVDCGGPCAATCPDVVFPLRAAQMAPITASGARGTCEVVIAGSHQSFTISCTHDVVNATSIRILRGAPGANGTVAFDLGSAVSPATASFVLLASDAAELLAGSWYVMISSTAFPNGELRGQIATTTTFPIVPRLVVPPVTTSFHNGSCTSFLSPDQTTLALACTHTMINPAPTALSIRRGAPGATGTVVAALASATTPVNEVVTLTPADAADYLAGNLYVSVETDAFPSGELRGQMAKMVESLGAGDQAVPSTLSTARALCRSFLSPGRTRLDLTCTHDVPNVTSAVVLRGAPWAAGTDLFGLGTGASPIHATLTLSAQDVLDYDAGNLAVDVRSGTYLSGEVRAQIASNVSVTASGRQHIPEISTVRSAHCTTHLPPRETELLVECVHDITDPGRAHLHNCSAACPGHFRLPDWVPSTSPFTATVPFSTLDVDEYVAGNWYIHIHSSVFPEGEIRGQITETYDFDLDGNQVVPPSGSTATGQCFAFLGFQETPSLIVRCDHSVQQPTGANVRRGPAGANGALMLQLGAAGVTAPTGTAPGTLLLQSQVSSVMATDLRAGNVYLEITSTPDPTGEIRGQVAGP